MKKYILGSVLLSTMVFVSGVSANEGYTTENYQKPVERSAGYTAAQIREKIANLQKQVAIMQEQIAKLEALAKKADVNGGVISAADVLNQISKPTETKDKPKPMPVKDILDYKNYPSDKAMMNASDMASFKRQLNFGHTGDDVKVLQAVLKEKGFLTGKADGVFGNMTKEAVRKMQDNYQLPVSGTLDVKTIQMLLDKKMMIDSILNKNAAGSGTTTVQ